MSEALLIPIAGATASLFLATSVVVGIRRWFADMYKHSEHLARGSGADSMEALAQRMATADLVVIATLADLRVEPAEEELMSALVARDTELEGELRDAFTRWRARPEILTDDGARARALRAAAGKLTSAQRKELREIVAAQAPDSPPAPSDPAHPYRTSATDAPRTLRDELLAALA
jgi:hypothetical protein